MSAPTIFTTIIEYVGAEVRREYLKTLFLYYLVIIWSCVAIIYSQYSKSSMYPLYY